jgi:hypothetical protein
VGFRVLGAFGALLGFVKKTTLLLLLWLPIQLLCALIDLIERRSTRRRRRKEQEFQRYLNSFPEIKYNFGERDPEFFCFQRSGILFVCLLS